MKFSFLKQIVFGFFQNRQITLAYPENWQFMDLRDSLSVSHSAMAHPYMANELLHTSFLGIGQLFRILRQQQDRGRFAGTLLKSET